MFTPLVSMEQSKYDQIDAWAAALASDNVKVRQAARDSLVAAGSPAVPALVNNLSSPSDRMRWESVKALGAIRDPAAAPHLVRALEDDRAEIRWLAAEALLTLGRPGLPYLLRALIHHSDSVRLREGAHRILRQWARGYGEIVVPVVEALEDLEPTLEVPVAAYKVLALLGEE